MLDLGWSELLVIGIVALIVVGPKDLPQLFRSVGRFTGKAKAMAREFSSAMNAAADEAGVKDIQKTINAAANPAKSATDSFKNSVRDIGKDDKDDGKPKSTLSPERQEAADKIRENAARMAKERQAREAAAEAELSDEPELPEDKPA